MTRYIKFALLTFMTIMISIPTYSATKKVKKGFFMFEGAIDKKTKEPNGEGTLYFLKSLSEPEPFKNFENLKITSGTFNGWKGTGTIQHLFWTYTGEIEVTENTLILTKGEFEVLLFDKSFLDQYESYRKGHLVQTLWGRSNIPYDIYRNIKYKLTFRNSSPISFMSHITNARNNFIQDDTKNSYLEDVNISPWLDRRGTNAVIDFKKDIQKMTNNQVEQSILKQILSDFDNGIAKIKLTVKYVRHEDNRLMPLYSYEIDTNHSNLQSVNFSKDEIELENKKGMGFWCRKASQEGYYLIEKYGQIGDAEIERMYCSADNCWYINKPYSDGTQISGVFITPNNEIKFGRPAGDGLYTDNTVTSWYKKNGKIYQDENPRENVYKLNDAKATSQLQTVDIFLNSSTLPNLVIAKRSGNTIVANANTKQVLGTIMANGKYKAEPTASRQTAKRKATRSSSVEAAQTMISLYKEYKDGRKRYKEEQRRKAIRKMLKKVK